MGRNGAIAGLAAAVVVAGLVSVASGDAVLATDPYRPPLPGARLVHVGGGELRDETVGEAKLQLQAFYPETLQVHRGDLVEWRFAAGFATMHTVTFLPGDMDVQVHTEPREDAHEPVIRSDELPPSLALSEEAMQGTGCGLIFPSEIDGRTPQDPCVIDSTDRGYGSRLSDGLVNIDSAQPQGFAAKIELEPGTYRYHCAMHPTMHGQIRVVPDDEVVPTQQEVDEQAKTQIELDLETGLQMYEHLSVPQVEFDGDHRVWDVHVGAQSEDGRVAINDYLPPELEVSPGDSVRFLASGSEIHTATFPMEAVGSFTLGGCDMSRCDGELIPTGTVALVAPPVCDYDHPAGGLPGAPSWVPGAGCPPGGALEWQLAAHAVETVAAPDDRVATTATYHSSGFMISDDQPAWFSLRPDGTPWVQEFNATFPTAGTFTYACLIHTGKATTDPLIPSRTGMLGTIRVVPS